MHSNGSDSGTYGICSGAEASSWNWTLRSERALGESLPTPSCRSLAWWARTRSSFSLLSSFSMATSCLAFSRTEEGGREGGREGEEGGREGRRGRWREGERREGGRELIIGSVCASELGCCHGQSNTSGVNILERWQLASSS